MLKIDYTAFFSLFCLSWQKKVAASLPAADFTGPKLAIGS